MPEGPEVRVLADFICKKLKGKCLQEIKFLGGPYLNHDGEHYVIARRNADGLNVAIESKKVVGAITNVSNKGKFIYILITVLKKVNNKLAPVKIVSIGSSLGLKGTWSDEKDILSRICIEYTDKPIDSNKKYLYYNDPISNGRFYVQNKEWLSKKLDTLGPDCYMMTNTEFNERLTIKRIQNKQLHIVLPDQAIISGIGNYMRADIIYLAHKNGVPTFSLIEELTDEHKLTLFNAIKAVYKANYKAGKRDPLIYKKLTSPERKTVQKLTDSKKRIFYYVD